MPGTFSFVDKPFVSSLERCLFRSLAHLELSCLFIAEFVLRHSLRDRIMHSPYLHGSSCSLDALKHKCCQFPWSQFSQIFFDYFMSPVTVTDPQLRRCALSLNSDIYIICLNSFAGAYSIDPESILEKITLSLQCWLCYSPCQNQLNILRFSFVSWIFHSIALRYLFLFRPVPHCFDYCSFVVFFKIKMNEPSKIFLQCFTVFD